MIKPEDHEEIFRDVKGFENYQISNMGRIKSKSRKIRYTHAVTGQEHFREFNEKYLKTYESVHGYKFVQLKRNKKSKNLTIHRLVALNFIDNDSPNTKTVVNHIDGNKHNNTVFNLEWVTNAYNHEHATRTGLKPKGEGIGTSKLTERCVKAIRHFSSSGYSDHQLSKIFDISRPTIHLIRMRKIWKHV